MKPRKASDIASSLERKGFVASHSHHTYFILYVKGKKTTIRTKISNGKRECDQYILAQMAKQVHLSGSEFGSLLDCPLSHEALVDRLRNKGLISL